MSPSPSLSLVTLGSGAEPPTIDAVPDAGIAVIRRTVSRLEPFRSRVASVDRAADSVSARWMVHTTVTGSGADAATLTARVRGRGDDRVAVVDCHVQFDDAAAVASPGAPRFVSFFQRQADLTTDEFWHHWTERHAPLVLASGPGFYRYATGRVLAATFDVDGVVEQRFVDEDALDRHHGATGAKPEVVLDAQRFVGSAESYIAYVVDERE